MSTLAYSLRLLWRDWRAGELHLLAIALFLAVTAITSVAWLAERVGVATEGRAAELLGGDRALASTRPIPERFVVAATDAGLRVSKTMEFPSVIVVDERTQLTAIKAVDTHYPLRGELLVGDTTATDRRPATTAPATGTVWAEPRLLLQIDADTGAMVDVGESTLTIEQVLFLDPAFGAGFQNFAPRLMMALDDVPATGLVQDASRVRYRLLVAGPTDALAAWERAIRSDLGRNISFEAPGEGQPGVEQVLQAAQRFLGLSALLTVLVGGVAMLLIIRRYAARHLDRVAIMRCIGASGRQIALIMTGKMVMIGLVAGLAGTLAGYLIQNLMLTLLAGLIPEQPATSLRPAVIGVAVAQIILLGFALPTVLRLRHVPPLRVLRRDLGSQLLQGHSAWVVALGAVFLLMWWQAGDLPLAIAVFGATLGTLALLGVVSAGLVWLLRSGRFLGGGTGLLYSGIARRPWTATIQIVALGLGLMALLLLSVVREDLLITWQDRVPETAANHFLINIQPEEAAAIAEQLEAADIDAALAPMVRARLTGINTREIGPEDYGDARTRQLVRREFNMSWLDDLPADNRVVEGRWWNSAEPGSTNGEFSVESDIAERLGLSIGDTLHFDAGGQTFSGEITSLREVDWDNFNINFFVIASPGLLDDIPATYISSFHLPAEERDLLGSLVRAFPSVTVIDLDAILETVRAIMRQGSQVVQVMALLTLLSGGVVLFAALQVTREERRFESALLRAMGGRRRLIRRIAANEFILLGGSAGLIAGGGAALAGYLMANRLFGFDYALNLWLPLAGGVIGAAAVLVAGLLATRGLVRVSPMQLLKDAREN